MAGLTATPAHFWRKQSQDHKQAQAKISRGQGLCPFTTCITNAAVRDVLDVGQSMLNWLLYTLSARSVVPN